MSHRANGQWRGTGLSYDERSWCMLRKVASSRGTWFKLRRLDGNFEAWFGTAHFSPGCLVTAYEEQVHEHFSQLPQSVS